MGWTKEREKEGEDEKRTDGDDHRIVFAPSERDGGDDEGVDAEERRVNNEDEEEFVIPSTDTGADPWTDGRGRVKEIDRSFKEGSGSHQW